MLANHCFNDLITVLLFVLRGLMSDFPSYTFLLAFSFLP